MMKRMAVAVVLLAVTGGLAVGKAPEMTFPTAPWAGDGVGDYVIGPEYKDAPEFKARAGVPKGRVEKFTMASGESERYPGISKERPGVVPYTRKVGVYIPPGYVAGTPSPLIVCQDANHQDTLPTILDNMIHEKRIPAMVAVFVGNGGGDGKGSQRGLEYDTLSPKYAEFVEYEVLPRITRDYGVTFTKDPDARATLGCSSGAAAAFTMAWFHNDWYRRVLSYSGTYVDQQSPPNPESPHGAWEYHENLIPKSARRPIRIWMQVGELDNRADDPEETLHNWVLANVRMAEALKAKGYEYQFVYAKGAKHCDGRMKRETLPRALEWLWKDYRAK